MDKYSIYLIPIAIVILSIFYIIHTSKPITDKYNNPTPQKNITYGQLLDDLQKKYFVGFKGEYIPVPISDQPIQALPFNPGLKPCELKFPW
jgi:hypothetical protein